MDYRESEVKEPEMKLQNLDGSLQATRQWWELLYQLGVLMPAEDSPQETVSAEVLIKPEAGSLSDNALNPPVTQNREDFDQVTCFCGQPYNGRNMIFCDAHSDWVHYSCTGIRKDPTRPGEKFTCSRCYCEQNTKRRSQRLNRSARKVLDL